MATPSPTKGITSTASDGKAADAPNFTEKEERVLKVAWHCLKSGPPEVDLDKLMKLGDFRSKKTASNTWGVIKNKLKAIKPADDVESQVTPATSPQKSTSLTKVTPKKRGKKAAENEDGEEAEADFENNSPVKKSRKKPIKNEPDEGVAIRAKEQVSAHTDKHFATIGGGETGLIFIQYEDGVPDEEDAGADGTHS